MYIDKVNGLYIQHSTGIDIIWIVFPYMGIPDDKTPLIT